MARDSVWIWLDSVTGGTGFLGIDALVEHGEKICSDVRYKSLCTDLNGYYRFLRFGPQHRDRRYFDKLRWRNYEDNPAGIRLQTNLANRLTRADIEVYSTSRVNRSLRLWPKYCQMRTSTSNFDDWIRHRINYSDQLGEIELLEIDYTAPNYGSFQGHITFRHRPVSGFRLWITCWGEGEPHYRSSSGYGWHGYGSAANVTSIVDPSRPQFYATGALLKGRYIISLELEITRPNPRRGDPPIAYRTLPRESYVVDLAGVNRTIPSDAFFSDVQIQRWIDDGLVHYADERLLDSVPPKWIFRHNREAVEG